MSVLNHKHYALNRLQPSDWKCYKLIRLEALQLEPEMFGSSFETEASYSEQTWTELLENKLRAIFGLYHKEELIGLCGVAIREADPTKAILFSSYIRTEYRGRGLSKLFYEARIQWALEHHCQVIVVSHRAGNEASKAANQRFGFQHTLTHKVRWPDGADADEINYSLKL